MDYKIENFAIATENQNLKTELAEIKNKLIYAEKMSALGQLACGLAHEIKTPVAAIYLKSELLTETMQEKTFDYKQAHKFVRDINHLIERVSKIIRCLNVYSRDACNDSTELFSVKEIVTDSIFLFSRKMLDNNVELLSCEIPSDWQIICRPTQICQVIVNLLNNAFDAVADNPEKIIEISVCDLKENIQISVSDNGPGIPAHLTDKIMQPFFTSKEPGKGTGLGLSISKEIIDFHNGVIFHERIGDKTKFSISLPKNL